MSEVLYRKYRARQFTQIYGQNNVVDIIKHAITTDQVAHAYLFTGPRGTGKTSIARLIAKAVNCEEFLKKGDICNTCANCVAFNNGQFMDLIEIDAASNRGIEEIRALKDTINYLPTQGKKKIYIIDEVHMLTREAFNALLKTLEEPPAHVIFILATTESHKVPATILSRVQRYDFRLGSKEELTSKLTYILESEGKKIVGEVLDLVYEQSEGSFRDAESILGKLMGQDIEKLDRATAEKVLGLVSSRSVEEFTKALLTDKPTKGLEILEELAMNGVDLKQFIKQLITNLRGKMLTAIAKEKEYRSFLVAINKLLKVQAEGRYIDDIRMLLEIMVLEGTVTNVTGEKSARTIENDIKPVTSSEAKMETRSETSSPDKVVTEAIGARTEAKKVHTKKDESEIDIKPNGKRSAIDPRWQALLVQVKKASFKLWAIFRSFEVETSDNTLLLKSKYKYNVEVLEEENNKELLSKLVKELYGSEWVIEFQLVKGARISEMAGNVGHSSNESLVEELL